MSPRPQTATAAPSQLVLSQYLFYGMMSECWSRERLSSAISGTLPIRSYRAVSFATFFNTLYYFARRAGPDGPTMASSSTTDPSGTTLNYFPDDLLFAWGWASTPDQVQALNTASSIFFITIIVCQLGNYMSVRRRCSPYFSDFVVRWSCGGTLPSNVFDAPPDPILAQIGATPIDFLRNLTVYLMPTIPIVGAFVLEIVFAIIIIGALQRYAHRCSMFFLPCPSGTACPAETPGAQATFSTSHVPGENWGIAIGFSLAAFTISEAGKWWIHFHPTSILRAIFWK